MKIVHKRIGGLRRKEMYKKIKYETDNIKNVGLQRYIFMLKEKEAKRKSIFEKEKT